MRHSGNYPSGRYRFLDSLSSSRREHHRSAPPNSNIHKTDRFYCKWRNRCRHNRQQPYPTAMAQGTAKAKETFSQGDYKIDFMRRARDKNRAQRDRVCEKRRITQIPSVLCYLCSKNLFRKIVSLNRTQNRFRQFFLMRG